MHFPQRLAYPIAMDHPETRATSPPNQGCSRLTDIVTDSGTTAAKTQDGAQVPSQASNQTNNLSLLIKFKQENAGSNFKMGETPQVKTEDEVRDDMETLAKDIERLEKRKQSRAANGQNLTWTDANRLNAAKEELEGLRSNFPDLAPPQDEKTGDAVHKSRNGTTTSHHATRQSPRQKRKSTDGDDDAELIAQRSVPNKKSKLDKTSRVKNQGPDQTQVGVNSLLIQPSAEHMSLVQKRFNEVTSRAWDTPGVDASLTRSEEQNLEKSIKNIGEENLNVTPQNGRWLVKGITKSLYTYQLDGTGWMYRQERRKSAPKGGILADAMGLGKTITTLAMMTAKGTPTSYKVRTSLLFVPNAQMAKQWTDEAKENCEDLAMVPWGDLTLSKAVLANPQVIVITYNELQTAWGRSQKKIKSLSKRARESQDDLKKYSSEELLFKAKFFRIILDEGHYVKNHLSATAKAMFEVDSHIQWIITATPAPNQPSEYYSYLKILKMDATQRMRDFTKYWLMKSKVGDEIHTRLDLDSPKFQLRRGYKTKLFGEAVFADVPESFDETVIVNLTEE